MNRQVKRASGVARTMVDVTRAEQVTFLAAAVAYYGFVSLIPLTGLALVVATVVGGEALADQVLAATERALTPEAQELVRVGLTAGTGRGSATVVGTLALLWGGLKVFRGLDRSFSAIYGTTDQASFLDELVDALVVLVGIGGGVAAVTLVASALALVASPLLGLLAPFSLVVTLTVAFVPMYYRFPDTDHTVRGAMPGAVFAAVGWTLLVGGFQLYAANAGSYAVYGLLGAVLLVLTWLYVGALLVMLGAVLNAVLVRDVDDAETVDRQLQHPGGRHEEPMTGDDTGTGRDDEDAADEESGPTDGTTTGAVAEDLDRADVEDLQDEIDRLRDQLEDFEEDVEDRTVDRDEVERDLRRYVRRRVRRGHARGWGPYVVLLYGTAMTVGAYYFLSGGWAILAMLVVWLSTLGLYTLMVIVGTTVSVLGLPGRLRDAVGRFRDR